MITTNRVCAQGRTSSVMGYGGSPSPHCVSRFAAPDGTSLACTEVGAGARLLCLPGGPGRASAYLEDLGGLSAERTLVLLDSRATGASEVPADPSSLRFDRLAEDVDALREHLGMPIGIDQQL